ncbi:WGR domain-containing protein [Sulfitobacter aestuarii]|uniref:WGR domain-containing protein n=1 Tax=Sulfitobacter aestuarii TaxID=2161676 RepID=A0ABW5U4A4_9RHOB
MLECLLYRRCPARRPAFYRVEITQNLFSEVSVLREWGHCGTQPRVLVNCFSNLRDASKAADGFRDRALRRGYLRAEV